MMMFFIVIVIVYPLVSIYEKRNKAFWKRNHELSYWGPEYELQM